MKLVDRLLGGLVIAVALGASGPPATVSAEDLDCPETPNCVSSEARRESQRVAPLHLQPQYAASWRRLHEAVAALPRTRIVSVTDTTLHAACRSRVFGFVDDLKLVFDPSNGRVAVRSAARSGHSDLGVNRRRVEALRRLAKDQGIVR